MNIRKKSEKFGEKIDQVCPPGKTCEDLIEEFANEIRIETLKEAAEHCLCTRNTYGFDYAEIHDKLGKPKVGARWLTPSDLVNKAVQILKAKEGT